MRASSGAVAALMSLLLVVACAQPSNGPIFQSRIATAMTPEQPCNRVASVQYVPAGARIEVPADALFLPGKADLTQCGQIAMTSAIQAMLDPRIMYVAIEPYGDVDAPYALLARQRADRLRGFFSNVGFTGSQPPVAVQPAVTPNAWGVVLTAADRG